jgi:hypothetical protein
LRKAAGLSLFAAVVCLTVSCIPASSQEAAPGGTHSFGFSTSYSADSSHILIGNAEQRRIWTLGAEYTHLLHQTSHLYEASVMPLFEETDPTVAGTMYTYAGQTIISAQPPTRVIYPVRGPVGYVVVSGVSAPITAITGREDTYAGAVSPLGARVSAFPARRIQPSFCLNLGFVASARDIPVDQSAQFNYMFAFGPGLNFFTDAHTSWRLEYIYRHTSNAGQGNLNPGVDQGVIRITISLHR